MVEYPTIYLHLSTSYGKVIFSCVSTHTPGHQTWDLPALAPPLLVISDGHHWRHVQTTACSLEDTLPLVLRFGGHQYTYGRQADDTHSTGILYCSM